MNGDPEVIYDFDPHKLPPEFLRAIGLVVAASAQTESIVQSLIGGLLGIDQMEAIAVASHMTGPLKDNVARTLCELCAPDVSEVDRLDELLDAVNTAVAKRNVLVHNSFARHPENGEVFSYRQTARGSLQVSLKPIRVEQIEQDALAIYEVGMNLMKFMMSRGLLPKDRVRPIYRPIVRDKKARERRKAARAGKS